METRRVKSALKSAPARTNRRDAEGIARRFAERFEGSLARLREGLSRPRTRKGLGHVWRSVGRISRRSRGIAQHCTVDVVADPGTGKATAVTWEKKPVTGTMPTHPGVCCLKTNAIDWDQETLWRTCTMLADLESVFRSLKPEPGLRPVCHQTQGRADGHLFITVLDCQMVQTIRRRLREQGETSGWATLRRILAGQ